MSRTRRASGVDLAAKAKTRDAGTARRGSHLRRRQKQHSGGDVKSHRLLRTRRNSFTTRAVVEDEEAGTTSSKASAVVVQEAASADLSVIYDRFVKLTMPYWTKERNENARQAQLMLAGVFALTLGCTGVSVLFNFLGRDFYNALAEKDVDGFWHQMQVYLVSIPLCIPVYVFRDFFSSRLQLRWRR